LSVEFAALAMEQVPEEGDIARIRHCRGRVATGKITSTLHRKPAR
jgi:hypothetical protein